MSSNHRKGYTLEALIRDDLKSAGVEVYRPRAGAVRDEGDIKGIPGVVVECKNRSTLALPQWWRETLDEAEHAEAELALLVHKRKGKGQADEQWVTMDWAMAKRLLRAAGLLPEDDDE